MNKERLGKHIEITNGFAFKSSEYSDKGARVIRITNVQKGEIKDDNPKFYPFKKTENLNKYQIFEKDILMSLTGNVGRVGRFPSELLPAYINQRICRIKSFSKELLEDYLYHILNSDNFEKEAIKASNGMAQLNLSTKWIEDFQILIPPLPEQKRIAAILDKADALRQNNKQLLAAYDELLQATFLDMFGDPVTNPKGWRKLTVSDFAETRLGKMLDKKKIEGNNLKPYLRNSNVLWFGFKLDDLIEMDFDGKDQKEFTLRTGDVLMCEGGEIGRCAVWQEEINDVYFQKAIHRIRLDSKMILPDFFVRMFWFYAMNGGLNKFLGAATILHLTGVNLRKILLPVPPITLQNQFALIVKNIEAQKAILKQSVQESEDLFNGLVQKAFNVELR
jgi:type I restriction enzyme S subunit